MLLHSADRQLLSQSAAASEEEALKHETLLVTKALRRRADVLSADPNYRYSPSAIFPNDQHYGLQWPYPLLNLTQAWSVVPDTSTVVVAVIDTGVFMDHVDLAASLLADGYDFISNPGSALDGDGIDPDPDDPGDSTTPNLSSFHGTHVAGTISAVSNNQAGVAGITWGPAVGMSRILPVRSALTAAPAVTSSGVRYAARITIPPYGTGCGHNIINLVWAAAALQSERALSTRSKPGHPCLARRTMRQRQFELSGRL
jgi:serine protease